MTTSTAPAPGEGGAGDDFINPFSRETTAPVEPLIEAWARALCVAFGAKPDKIIGFPPAPRWRSWVGYAELSVKAQAALSPDLSGGEG